MNIRVQDAVEDLTQQLECSAAAVKVLPVKRTSVESIVEYMTFHSFNWGNYSALGHAVLAAEKMGLPEEQIMKLLVEMEKSFYAVSLEEAANHYKHSKY